jgi:hypothetical protein
MRYFLLGVAGVILVLGSATPVRAHSYLTEAVNAVWGDRVVGDWLHEVAHRRVVEISSCGTCMNHNRMRPGTTEVLGYNAGYRNPVARVIRMWRESSVHNAILSNRTLRRIGCAQRVVGTKHYFACVLALPG